MPPASHPLTCSACRVIDLADGVEDGQLFSSLAVPDERRMWRLLRKAQDRIADTVTGFAGSMRFVYLHAGWFAFWILVNTGIIAGHAFDRYPFGLLTMIVSLEAIFLATFVMISQNRQAARADLRAEIDFETNLRAEIWAVHIGQQLGIDAAHVESVVAEAIAGSRAHLGTTAPTRA